MYLHPLARAIWPLFNWWRVWDMRKVFWGLVKNVNYLFQVVPTWVRRPSVRYSGFSPEVIRDLVRQPPPAPPAALNLSVPPPSAAAANALAVVAEVHAEDEREEARRPGRNVARVNYKETRTYKKRKWMCAKFLKDGWAAIVIFYISAN